MVLDIFVQCILYVRRYSYILYIVLGFACIIISYTMTVKPLHICNVYAKHIEHTYSVVCSFVCDACMLSIHMILLHIITISYA